MTIIWAPLIDVVHFTFTSEVLKLSMTMLLLVATFEKSHEMFQYFATGEREFSARIILVFLMGELPGLFINKLLVFIFLPLTCGTPQAMEYCGILEVLELKNTRYFLRARHSFFVNDSECLTKNFVLVFSKVTSTRFGWPDFGLSIAGLQIANTDWNHIQEHTVHYCHSLPANFTSQERSDNEK